MTIRVGAIVVNYNGGTLLQRCLAAIYAQSHPFARVLVVDNGSSDGSVDALETRFPGAEVWRAAANLGFAGANNRGAERLADVDWLALINPDAFLQPDWLEQMLDHCQAHPQQVAIGCTLLDASHPSRLDGSGDCYHVSGRVWRRDKGRLLTEASRGAAFSVCAAACLYQRQVFMAMGGFDETLFCYLEDVDLGFRLRLAGYAIGQCREAHALHQGSASSGEHSDFSVYHGHRNLVWVFVKNMPLRLLWRYLPQHLLLNGLSVAYFLVRGQGWVILRAKWDALQGLATVWRQRQSYGDQAALAVINAQLSRGWWHPYQQRP